ncbi:MAG: hypothetical protein GX601_00045, partial [Anaerolineales bacterium]|nr:hypothetical protein [Anaerolineales bacterium]
VITHERLPVGLATEAYDPLNDQQARFYLPPRSQRAQLMSVLEVLARVETCATTCFESLLREETIKLSWGSTVTVVTGSASETLFDTLAYLRRTGLAVALILVQPTHTSFGLQGRARLLGIPIQQVWEEGDLESWH